MARSIPIIGRVKGIPRVGAYTVRRMRTRLRYKFLIIKDPGFEKVSALVRSHSMDVIANAIAENGNKSIFNMAAQSGFTSQHTIQFFQNALRNGMNIQGGLEYTVYQISFTKQGLIQGNSIVNSVITWNSNKELLLRLAGVKERFDY